jgi:hypothetical protein
VTLTVGTLGRGDRELVMQHGGPIRCHLPDEYGNILANTVEICFRSFTATSITLATIIYKKTFGLHDRIANGIKYIFLVVI